MIYINKNRSKLNSLIWKTICFWLFIWFIGLVCQTIFWLLSMAVISWSCKTKIFFIFFSILIVKTGKPSFSDAAWHHGDIYNYPHLRGSKIKNRYHRYWILKSIEVSWSKYWLRLIPESLSGWNLLRCPCDFYYLLTKGKLLPKSKVPKYYLKFFPDMSIVQYFATLLYNVHCAKSCNQSSALFVSIL